MSVDGARLSRRDRGLRRGRLAAAVLAIPSAVLLGVAFTTPFAAYAATRNTRPRSSRCSASSSSRCSSSRARSSRSPSCRWARVVAYVTPLWHGVDLCRGFTLGTVDWLHALAHVAYLSVFVVAGLLVGRAAPWRGGCANDRGRIRRQPRATPLRAQPHGLPALLDDHLLRDLRAALLPLSIGVGSGTSSGRCRSPTVSWSATELRRAGAPCVGRDERRGLRRRSTSSTR